ncbi:MAG: single-stranded DNA-binding protein [Methylotenera sp.]|nr:single-stranded DNA-binding protein [Oligoflexia bacterium]
MKDVNKIILMGRLGADPIQRETKSGLPVVHFPLATARKVKDGSGALDDEGERIVNEETQWHRVVAWGKQGEACAQHLKKGQAVFVEGNLRSRKYEGKDGTSRMSFEVHVENISFLGGSSRPQLVQALG